MLRQPWIPLVALAATLAMSIWGWEIANETQRAKVSAHFLQLIEQNEAMFKRRLARYEDALWGARGLFYASENVTHEEWKRYVSTLNLGERYPGMLGLSFAEYVPHAQLENFVESIQAETGSSFRIHPEGERGDYFIVRFMEPETEENKKALGFDLGSDMERRKTAEEARDIGKPVLTGPISLIQTPDKSNGALFFLPVFEFEASEKTPETRRESLKGWVTAPLQVDTFFNALKPAVPSEVDFQVWSLDDQQDAVARVFEGWNFPAPEKEPRAIRLQESRKVTVAGQTWLFVWNSTPYFRSPIPLHQPKIVLGTGAALGVLLFLLLIGMQAVERDRALAFEREKLARSEAEKANRGKDEFLAVLSHELRTPLQAIISWAQLMRSGKLNPANSQKGLQLIERSALLQARIINDLLDVSRAISGKLRMELQMVPISVIAEAALEAQRPAAEAAGIQLVSKIPLDIGTVLADPGRISQVFGNLLSNAIKFTPRNGRIEFQAERVHLQGKATARITIKDTGKGISPDFIPYIFERFSQADSSITRGHGGLGLGLAIAQHLIKLHGGSIRAESEGEGQGSIFTVDLPLADTQPVTEPITGTGFPLGLRREPMPENADATSAPVQLQDLHGAKILVVDDDADARDAIQAILVECRAQVSTASSGADALQSLRQKPFDLIISDIGMPGEDGYSFIRSVRRLEDLQARATPAIALTAYASEIDKKRAISAGFQMHTAKPVEPEALSRMVASLVVKQIQGTRMPWTT